MDGSTSPHLVRTESSELAAASSSSERDIEFSDTEAGTLSRHSLAFLVDATRLLANSLDLETTLATVARLALPQLGAWCIVDLHEGGQMRRLAVVHPDPGHQEPADRLRTGWPPERGDPIGIPRVMQTRHVEVIPEVSDEMLVRVAKSPENLSILRRLEIGSVMTVPLVARGEVFGAITYLSSTRGDAFSDGDRVLAEDLGLRCAIAIDNARLYSEAKRAVRAREEILNVVSHDLRNPLSSIRMGADLLRDPAHERREEDRHWLEMISRSVGQMDRMIGDLLDLAQIDSGRFAVEPGDHDVAALLGEVEEAFAPLAAEKEIRLEFAAPAALPSVRMDHGQILRVLSNLVGNAVKFTPEGGTITVGADMHEGEVRFRVSDTGPGIPADQLPHVFERYWQARPGDRRGAGLGLAIIEGIVGAHRGRTWAESEVGKGATFSFTLPLDGPADRREGLIRARTVV
jgi:signal transduction histidine kinase